MSTSVKSSEKQLPSHENVGTILEINCSNFTLEKVEKP